MWRVNQAIRGRGSGRKTIPLGLRVALDLVSKGVAHWHFLQRGIALETPLLLEALHLEPLDAIREMESLHTADFVDATAAVGHKQEERSELVGRIVYSRLMK